MGVAGSWAADVMLSVMKHGGGLPWSERCDTSSDEYSTDDV